MITRHSNITSTEYQYSELVSGGGEPPEREGPAGSTSISVMNNMKKEKKK